MEARRIDPESQSDYSEWFALWRLTDLELWPDVPGWDERDIWAMARQVRSAHEHQLLAAYDDGGAMVGIGLLDLPQRDNRHSMGIDVRVHPDHRRVGVGRSLVDCSVRLGRAEGRTVLNGFFEVPTECVASHPSGPFARSQGFEATLFGNRRHLALPVEPERLARLRRDVANARGTAEYRTMTFTTPWPDEYLEDQCEMQRRMSTDQPSGDALNEEEVWDASRVAEGEELLAEQSMTKLVAVAQHIESGRLVAFSEIVVSELRPTEAWQWQTLVLAEYRGRRLGLAVKMANLDFLSTVMPTARRVITGNAQENAPMIAVNDALGFEVVATGTFWQKSLSQP
jgi:GNAT superfamily N-acetyltransferase